MSEWLNAFSNNARQAMANAISEAQAMNHGYVGTEHIFLGMMNLENGLTNTVLQKMRLGSEEVRRRIREYVGVGHPMVVEGLPKDKMMLTPRTAKVIELSMAEAKRLGFEMIDEVHILLALVTEGKGVPIRILREMNVDPVEMRNIALELCSITKEQAGDPNTPLLNRLGRDLTQLAREGKFEPVIGRSKEIESMVEILMKKKKNNPLLVGEAGVGKTAIVEGLALEIASGKVISELRDKRIVELSTSSLVAGTAYRGQFEERLTGIIKEATASENIFIFIDEIHTIVGAGGAEGSVDAGNILKPALARGLRCIGATTFDEYTKYIKKDKALDRRFEIVVVKEPSEAQTIEILKGLRKKYEEYHGVTITDEAIKAAVEFSVKYRPERRLPDKAIDLIDKAAARLKIQTFKNFSGGFSKEELDKKFVLRREDVAAIVAEWGVVSPEKLRVEEKERLIRMDEMIKQRIVGQDHCVQAVCKRIRRAKAGMAAPNRPIGVFLFLGPTGVGKTELARALAEFLFGDESKLITLNMSEYKERHDVSKILGPPPGYIGFDEVPALTKLVGQNPFSIVVLDEIEKAHPEIFDVFLRMFDEGKLTDSHQNTINFCNTVIIMTSNIGMNLKRTGRIGFRPEAGEEQDEEFAKEARLELQKVFKPEFLNRIDDILVFNPLTEENLKMIAKIVIKKFREERPGLSAIDLIVTDGAINFLVKKTDLAYGARPLKRDIEKWIVDPITDKFLMGEIQEGDTVKVSEEQGVLRIEVLPRSEEVGKV